MKRRIIGIILLLLTLFWLFFIRNLSSQNGEDTTSLSLQISKFIAGFFFPDGYSLNQLNKLHMIIRKMAHIGLFFIFGVLITSMVILLLNKLSIKMQIIILLSISAVISFYDEASKISIVGRHFSLGESFLNMFSSFLGIGAIYFLVNLIRKTRKQKNILPDLDPNKES